MLHLYRNHNLDYPSFSIFLHSETFSSHDHSKGRGGWTPQPRLWPYADGQDCLGHRTLPGAIPRTAPADALSNQHIVRRHQILAAKPGARTSPLREGVRRRLAVTGGVAIAILPSVRLPAKPRKLHKSSCGLGIVLRAIHIARHRPKPNGPPQQRGEPHGTGESRSGQAATAASSGSRST